MPPPSGKTGAAGVALGVAAGIDGAAGVIGAAGDVPGVLGATGAGVGVPAGVGAPAGVGMDVPLAGTPESTTVPQPQPATGVPQQLIPQPEVQEEQTSNPQPLFQP